MVVGVVSSKSVFPVIGSLVSAFMLKANCLNRDRAKPFLPNGLRCETIRSLPSDARKTSGRVAVRDHWNSSAERIAVRDHWTKHFLPNGLRCETEAAPKRWSLTSFDASLEGKASPGLVSSLLSSLGRGALLDNGEVISLVRRASGVLDELPTLVEVDIPAGARLHIVGDIHGQYDEFMQVLEICGPPMPGQNLFVFNGDFVDRGGQSTEVMLGLLAMMLAYPGCVYLNRGNHESREMNRHYGFEQEVYSKCSAEAFEEFQRLFCNLPLATLVNRAVLVTHGGLPSVDGVTLRDIAALDRKREPHGGLMQDLLWSDPTHRNGRHRSPRGGTVSCFGPDVAARFCDDNGLLCCIRSHEMVEDGFAWQRGNRVLTVFSAANYVGRAGNLGAVVHISPGKAGTVEPADLSVTTFECRSGASRKRSRL